MQYLDYYALCNWCEWLRFKVAKSNFKSQPLNKKIRKSKKSKISKKKIMGKDGCIKSNIMWKHVKEREKGVSGEKEG